ncbi:hypothetical protein JQK15_15215 [Sphingobium sp. BHU LFT2]|uniref:hypothetical protein n=1 Tax=Sphingobium sp. BHU LFT2 TaxID=2807634 RepID=UPI001BE5F6FC|nr:hypothetical protein [Sphingobium sp. BHU LFT2]MBT2244893.1 hypothetical protein [Sphingobium sp. BHU LFT2]
MAYQDQDGPLTRLRDRLAQALFREPAVVLFERDADDRGAPMSGSDRERQPQDACA